MYKVSTWGKDAIGNLNTAHRVEVEAVNQLIDNPKKLFMEGDVFNGYSTINYRSD